MPELIDYSRSWAILLGTATYRDPRFGSLPAAANSLTGMRQVLTDRRLCAWPDERVKVFQDPTDVPRLVQALRRLARSTDDVLLMYFVGHGTILPSGELCLALTDTDFTDSDVTGLEYGRVRNVLRDSPARTKIVVLDCCYSGRAIEALSTATEIADNTETPGVYTLTASDHTAHVPPLAQQAGTTTSFTGELLDLIRTGIPGGSELLTLSSVYQHLRRRLHLRGLPAPNHRGTDIADQFPFTRNAALRGPHLPQSPSRAGAYAPRTPAEVALPVQRRPGFVLCGMDVDAGYARRLSGHLRDEGLPLLSLYEPDAPADPAVGASGVIVLMSPATAQSSTVQEVIGQARRLGLELLPVLMSGHGLGEGVWFHDARDGSLPGEPELRRLRRLHESHDGRAEASPVAACQQPDTGPSRLRGLLRNNELVSADLLTTSIILEAADRSREGWLGRSDGARLPVALLRECAEAWADSTGGRHGFGAQLERHGGHQRAGSTTDFAELAGAVGWTVTRGDMTGLYQKWVTRHTNYYGFFPTLRNPDRELHHGWYDRWVETVMAVHLQLRKRL